MKKNPINQSWSQWPGPSTSTLIFDGRQCQVQACTGQDTKPGLICFESDAVQIFKTWKQTENIKKTGSKVHISFRICWFCILHCVDVKGDSTIRRPCRRV